MVQHPWDYSFWIHQPLYINESELNVDLHYLGVKDVKVVLDYIFNNCPQQTKVINIIHGYNQGTVLRDFIRNEYVSPIKNVYLKDDILN